MAHLNTSAFCSLFFFFFLNKSSVKLILLLTRAVQHMFTSGQKMVEWNQLDVASFLEQATGFLAEHGQLDGPSCHAPPAKRARSVGLSSHVSFLIPLSQLRIIYPLQSCCLGFWLLYVVIQLHCCPFLVLKAAIRVKDNIFVNLLHCAICEK